MTAQVIDMPRPKSVQQDRPCAGGVGVGADGQCLPSGDAAIDLMNGKPGAVVKVLSTFAVRSALVTVGCLAAGLRGWDLVKGAAGASVAVELGVLGWAAYVTKWKP
jgi:hypothetical protein